MFAAAILVLATLAFAYGAGSKKKVVTPKDSSPPDGLSAPGFRSAIRSTFQAKPGPIRRQRKYQRTSTRRCANASKMSGGILKAGGMDFGDAVSVQVYLTDMSMFQRMNAVYVHTFPDPKPTRTTVGVAALSGGAHIEVTVTARK